MQNLILKVIDIKVGTAFNQNNIAVQPIGDTLFSVELDNEQLIQQEDGTHLLTVDGLRAVVRGLQTSLVVDVDKDSF